MAVVEGGVGRRGRRGEGEGGAMEAEEGEEEEAVVGLGQEEEEASG